ncbi:CDP-glucose 4,6-dehydratase, partial [Pelomonas sp. HMWF004]
MGFRQGAVEEVGLRAAMQQTNPEFWQGKRILLTGHTGFKGSW